MHTSSGERTILIAVDNVESSANDRDGDRTKATNDECMKKEVKKNRRTERDCVQECAEARNEEHDNETSDDES